VRVLGAIVMLDISRSTEHPTDLLNNTFGFLQRLAVPKSKHSETTSFELEGSNVVVVLPGICVLSSIELNNQPRFDAAEIDDE